MRPLHPLLCCTAAALLAVALPADAMYKIIGPDGRVTYTDRAPSDATPALGAAVTPAARTPASPTAAPARAGDAALPYALRQAAARFPVTLYVAEACGPCEEARELLRRRGIPHAERQVLTTADMQIFEQLSGGRGVPTLAVGNQILHGLVPAVWTQYLDLAGYPATSLLPPAYRPPPPQPLAERPVEPALAPPTGRTADVHSSALPPPRAAPAGAIRF